jgi:hypothetical protein
MLDSTTQMQRHYRLTPYDRANASCNSSIFRFSILRNNENESESGPIT